MPKNMTKYENEGLIRLDLDLDYSTYTFLLTLVEKFGYDLSSNKSEKSEGIRGVITQAILELYQKQEKNNNKIVKLNRVDQQTYIYANRIRAMRKNNMEKELVISKIQPKLPEYVKNSKNGKLATMEEMKKFLDASPLSKIKLPQLSESIGKELNKKKLLKYVELK